MGFWGDAWDYVKNPGHLIDPFELTPIGEGTLGDREGGPETKIPDADRANYNLPGGDDRANRLLGLADSYGGRTAPQAMGAQANDSRFRDDQEGLVNRLRNQMNGADSMSELQFRQATDANTAQQRSLAASANPNNAAMMARFAAQNIGKMSQGAAQQAAQLGIQERNAAANALGGVAGQGRAQDQGLAEFNAGQRQQNNQFNTGAQLQQTGLNDQASNNARGQELSNAELQQRGSMGYEGNQTTRRGQDLAVPVQPANWERLVGAAGAVAPLLSDERAKTDVSTPSGPQLDSLIDRLRARQFSYRDPKNGAGPRLGVMAQDVERGGPAGRSLVSEQPGGPKTLDVSKSLGTALGLIGRLGDRLQQLEGRR